MFSIFILTYNEEQDIAACIESALPCDDIIVVDSFSSDRTGAIVQALSHHYPVRLVQHRFESHGKQRTWMLQSDLARYDWAYILEADERMTPELHRECREAVTAAQANPDHAPVGFFAAERVMFLGSWIRHSTQYPRYQMRLLNREKVWFTDYGHTEREVCEGPTGFLKATYPHYTSGKGLSRWIDKHNRYSSDEALETLRQRQNGSVDWQALLFGKTEVERRHALKNLSQHIPLRPLARFFYMYILLGGWRDGRAGFRWCVLQMFYEYLILLKAWEIEAQPYAEIYAGGAVEAEESQALSEQSSGPAGQTMPQPSPDYAAAQS